jgi:hypothetical protein
MLNRAGIVRHGPQEPTMFHPTQQGDLARLVHIERQALAEQSRRFDLRRSRPLRRTRSRGAPAR